VFVPELNSICAPWIGAPVESKTVPWSADCWARIPGARTKRRRHAERAVRKLLLECGLIVVMFLGLECCW